MVWNGTLDSLGAAVAFVPRVIRRLWAGTPGSEAALVRQAEELLLAEWADHNEEERGALAAAMRSAQKPHTARLLEERRFPALRDSLIGVSVEPPQPLPQEPQLLEALAVWLLRRALEPRQHLDARGPRRVLELARALRRNGQAHLARRLLRQRLWQGSSFPPELFFEIRSELALSTALASDLAPGPRLEKAVRLFDANKRGAQEAEEAGAPRLTSDRWRKHAWIYRLRWEAYGRRTDLSFAAMGCSFAWKAASDPSDRLRNAADAAYYWDLRAFKNLRSPELAQADEIRLKTVQEVTEEGRRTDPPEEVVADPLLHYRWLLNLAQLQMRLEESVARMEKEGQDELQWARGLRDPLQLLAEARELGPEVPPWIQTRKVREFAERTRAWGSDHAYLQALLGEQAGKRDAIRRALSLGKVGLGLSGGGFRASLFHLGVLASLAEWDLLKRVEVLSCVSGGSIVGAHLYLKLRQLLSEKGDEEIEREDYIELVRELIHEFLAGVQKNVRTRVVANPLANLRMLLTPYTRSARAGDLMDRHLFRRARGAGDDGYRLLSELRVQPPDQPPGTGFNPVRDNWRREHKVPILTLNAASLNTGHSWQYAATWMGESPSAVDPEVDCNDRLRRMKLEEEAPPRHGRTRLGQAVAASACVPGLFEPATLRRLYDGKIVRLVDGGVFDNQGVAGLAEQGCRIVLVSDASGQIDALDRPSGGLLGSLTRANAILMDRVRQTQYRDLQARRRSEQLDHLSYVHLKQELEADTVNWLGCEHPKPSERSDETPEYGIPKTTQTLLAGIRTDLDSFCDAEAYALMYSGYRMMTSESERLRSTAGDDDEPEVAADWPFLCVEPRLGKPLEPRGRLESLLTVAGSGALKTWHLWRRGKAPARWAAAALAALPLAGLSWLYLSWLWGIWQAGNEASLSVSMPVLAVVPLAAVALFLIPPLRAVVGRTLNMLVFGIFGMVVSWVQLAVFDPLYLRYGREPGGYARRLLHEGEFGRARALLESLLAENPGDWLAQVGLARALLKLKRPEEAREALAAVQRELTSESDELQWWEVNEARQIVLRRRQSYLERLVAAQARSVGSAQAGHSN